MNSDIIDHHRAISATSERFLRYAEARPGGIGKLHLLDDDLPALLKAYGYPLHAWPWFISPATKAMLAASVERIPELVARAIRIEFEGRPQEMARFFGVPDVIAMLFLDGMPDIRYFLQRTDAVLTERGLKILEINVGSTIGGWQIQWMDKQYRKQGELAAFFDAVRCESRDIPYHFIDFIVASVLAKRLEVDGAVNVLFLVPGDFVETDGPAEATRLFERALAARGCKGNIRFQNTLDGVRFAADGVHLDDVRMSAVLCGGDIVDQLPQAFYRACFARQVWWADSPLETTLGDKRALALAWRHREHAAFSAEERALIERHIPWSTPARPGTVDFHGTSTDLGALLLERQQDFVVKIGQGLSGDDVFIGRFTPADLWRRIVERALGENGWLVQEFCASLPFYGQSNGRPVAEFDVIWGVFGFGKQYGGCWLRMMPRHGHAGVINSAKGAEEAIVYEVDE